MRKIVFLSVIFMAPLFAYELESLSLDYQKCIKDSDGVAAKLIVCADKEITIQTKQMDENYNLLLKRLKTQKEKLKLEDSQSKWSEYITSKCNFHDGISGQIWDKVNISQCYMEEVNRRSQDLKLWYDRLEIKK